MSILGNSKVVFSIEKIMELLPHRYPFLLVDRVTDIEEKRITAIKNVSINEPFFQGHFPGNPVMPGVLIIESMAQTAGIFALEMIDSTKSGKIFYFLTIENAKFRIPVVPGDVLTIKAELLKVHGTVCKFFCEAFVQNKLVAEATLCAKVMI